MNFTTPKLLYALWKHFSTKRKFQLWLVFALMLASSFAEAISLVSVTPFILAISSPDKLTDNPLIRDLLSNFPISDPSVLTIYFASLFILAVLLSSLLRVLNIKVAFQIAANIANDLGCKSYYRTLHQPYNIHLAMNTSEIISNNSIEIGRAEGAIFYTLNFLIACLITFVLIITLFLISPRITFLSTFLIGLGYLLFARWSRLILVRNSDLISNSNKLSIQSLQEGLGSIRDILLQGNQSLYVARFAKYDYLARSKIAEKNFIFASPRYLFEALGISLLIIFSLVLSFDTSNTSTILPTLAIFSLALQRLLPSMQLCYSSISNVRGVQSSLKSILNMLEQPIDSYTAPSADIKPYKIKNQIEFKNVYFAYSNRTQNILNNICFSIRKGEKIGIIGRTGSGKSTLIDLILGLLSPSSGEILIDNLNLKSNFSSDFLCSWQRSISHVPQNIFLHDSTIKENIAFGVPLEEIDHERLIKASSQAMLSQFVSSLPEGFDSNVGERGFQLSGGQRQRIGIARALYKQSSILVLDEATSALDTNTENKLLSSLLHLSQDLTLIMITHRANTLAFCDKIYELEKGFLSLKHSP